MRLCGHVKNYLFSLPVLLLNMGCLELTDPSRYDTDIPYCLKLHNKFNYISSFCCCCCILFLFFKFTDLVDYDKSKLEVLHATNEFF